MNLSSPVLPVPETIPRSKAPVNFFLFSNTEKVQQPGTAGFFSQLGAKHLDLISGTGSS